jgi:hypothetical protein
MRTHAEIVKAAGVQTVSTLVDKPFSTVSSWALRDSIPSEYWAALIEAGHATSEELIEAAAKKAA